MLRQVIVLALIGGALSYSINGADLEETRDRPGIPDIKYFDCSTTSMQHNKHPWDCTRFIQCDASGRAFDMPCPACNDPALCPGGGYLHFDGVLIDGKEPSCIWPVNSTCRDVVTTTVRPSPPPTCVATNCNVTVECRKYSFCERIDQTGDPDLINEGTEVVVDCKAQGKWAVGWATPNSNGDLVIGACLPWSELPQEDKDKCGLETCELMSLTDCGSTYQYRSDDGTLSAVLTCPSGLVIDIEQRGCVEKSKHSNSACH